jgi:hypothetical protein
MTLMQRAAATKFNQPAEHVLLFIAAVLSKSLNHHTFPTLPTTARHWPVPS